MSALFIGGVSLGILAVALVHGRATPATALDHASTGQTSTLPAASAGVQPDRPVPYEHEASNTSTSEQSTDGSVLAPGAHAAFEALRSRLPGPVDLAVAPVGSESVEVLGEDAPAHGWSTTKVPVLVALLKAEEPEGLSSEQAQLAHSAITESSNEAILALFHDLEAKDGGLVGASDAVESLFRLSGDNETTVPTATPPPGAVTTFGQTEWSPRHAVQFLSALDRDCLLPAAATSYVLGLMQRIEPSESWGLGSAGFGRVAFKGGWGPEGDKYLVRQSGIVNVGTSSAVAVAIVAYPPEGSASFSTGQTMLDSTARWLKGELRSPAQTSAACPQQ